jgi:agmatine deiminase
LFVLTNKLPNYEITKLPNRKPTSRAQQTPASLGYRMPAEWEPHASTWLGWPHNRTDWPGKFPPIPWVYAEIVRHLARVERVDIIVEDAAAEIRARKVLEHASAMRETVRFHRWRTNRGWTRDFAPILVKRDAVRDPVAAINFRFNAWAKYPDWPLDQRASEQIVRWLKFPTWRPGVPLARVRKQNEGGARSPSNAKERSIVLEGGSIDVNGRGLLLTTEECLLSETQQRNPGLTRRELERVFADYFGIEKVLWLERGIAGDDTHGHIDDLARFVSPDTIVTAVEGNRDDVNHQPLANNLQRLRAATDQRGHGFNIVELPMPAPVIFRGRRLPASYANFYIANRLVLAPVFNDRHDRLALNILADLFPDREIIPLYCGDLIWGLGAIHCMTMQQPA